MPIDTPICHEDTKARHLKSSSCLCDFVAFLVFALFASAARAFAQTSPLPAPFTGGTNGFLRHTVAEAGVHIPSTKAALDLFAAYERRVDGYPLARLPQSWVEAGFRLGSP